MEIRIKGYKRNGVGYYVKLNWHRDPVEAGIGKGRIDRLEIRKSGERKILCRYDGRWITPPGTNLVLHEIVTEMIEQFN